jgi:hypothetical protein
MQAFAREMTTFPLHNARAVALGAVSAVAGVGLFVSGFRDLSRKRLVADTPRSRARSAALGLAELAGVAVGPYTLTAPVARVPCFYYHVVIKTMGAHSRGRTVVDRQRYVPFYVRDETGCLMVDARDAEFDPKPEWTAESGTISGTFPDPATADYVRVCGVDPTEPYELYVSYLPPEQPIYVLGTVMENPGMAVEPPLDAVGLLDLCLSEEHTSATPRPASTDATGNSAASEFDLNPAIVIGRGEFDKRFLMSWCSQRDLQQNLAWRSTIRIWGGPVLALIGAGILVQQFGLIPLWMR